MSSNASSSVRSRRCRYGLTSELSTVVWLLATMTTFPRVGERSSIANQREAGSSQLHTRPRHQAIGHAPCKCGASDGKTQACG
jgi:hypothetical protein